jgi:hypothetical protein
MNGIKDKIVVITERAPKLFARRSPRRAGFGQAERAEE